MCYEIVIVVFYGYIAAVKRFVFAIPEDVCEGLGSDQRISLLLMMV